MKALLRKRGLPAYVQVADDEASLCTTHKEEHGIRHYRIKTRKIQSPPGNEVNYTRDLISYVQYKHTAHSVWRVEGEAMRPHDHDEVRFIEQICREIELNKSLGKEICERIENYFGERSHRALNLVEKGSVKRCRFKPSGRVIWEVKGRKSTYQVMPNTNFCSCDDYYFRVMNSKKQLCYHIIAQRIASALGKFEGDECHDRDYGKITRKWKKIVR